MRIFKTVPTGSWNRQSGRSQRPAEANQIWVDFRLQQLRAPRAAVSADLLLAMKGADDEQKLKYVTRLAMKEMRQLRHVMINHESVTLKEPLVLDDLGLSRKAEEHPVDEIERATAEMARKLSAEGK